MKAALLMVVLFYANCVRAQTELTPEQFGASGDFHELPALAIDAGDQHLRAAAGTFSPQDVGRTIFVFGAGSVGSGKALVTTVSAVDAGVATLANPASTSVQKASGGIGTDNAHALQACWDASSTRGLSCRMGAGRFLFASAALTVRRHMRAEGNSPEQTSLVCAPSLRECVVLDDGPVQFVTLDGWELAGSEGALAPPATNDAAQRGFVLRGRGDGDAGGGLWQSSFRHLQIAGFWGDELALLGGRTNTQHPNQFLFFEDVELQTARGVGDQRPPADSFRLRFSGQNAQIRFLGGAVHGSIASQSGNGVLIDGGGVIAFEGTACEGLDRCLVIPRATTISFVDGWIENVRGVVETGPDAVRGVFLNRNYLANSCFDLRDRSGFCFRAHGSTSQDLSFADNQLAWGIAPPDALLLGGDKGTFFAPRNDLNGEVRDISSGSSVAPAAASLWREAHSRTPQVLPGSRAMVTLRWQPHAFPTADISASCVTVGGGGELTVAGIDRLSGIEVRVLLENRSNRALRAAVQCTGVLREPRR